MVNSLQTKAILDSTLSPKALSCPSVILNTIATVFHIGSFLASHMNLKSHTTHSQSHRTELGRQRDNISVCTKVILPLSPHVPRDSFFLQHLLCQGQPFRTLLFSIGCLFCLWGMPKNNSSKTSSQPFPDSPELLKQSVQGH